MKYDYLIVGAGFSGCVLAERIATQLGKKCLIVEKRNHIGGNCYDYYDDQGVLIHKYGPHIFHTQMKKVWDYLSQFTEWIDYEHKVKAVIDGKEVPVPFNFNSIEIAFNEERAQELILLLKEKYGEGVKIPILTLRKTDKEELKELADFIYEYIFLGYNIKQWNMKPEDLDPSVSGRVPVFLSRDDRYFQDKFQAIPKHGYTKLFQKLINHKNIHIQLQTDYKNIIHNISYDKMIYTGHIDYFYDFKLGKLPYRTLNFDFQTIDKEFYQSGAQINYPNDYDYTRITEFKHLTKQDHKKTTIAYEYPKDYIFGENDPYYPIPKEDNLNLFSKYKELADKEKNVFFVGRLADYKYYNMDQTIGVALQLFENKIAK
jgi:UDP-galactopyranose mutase